MSFCLSLQSFALLKCNRITCTFDFIRSSAIHCTSALYDTAWHGSNLPQLSSIFLLATHLFGFHMYINHPLCYYLNVSNDLLSCSSFYSRSSQYLPLCFFPSLPTTLPLISFRLYRVTVIIGIIILI
jgi:hypothetical protein